MTAMTAMPPASPPIRWFPKLAAGQLRPGATLAETLASVAWLLMTELQAYIEDLEGAADTPDVVDVLRIKIAELLLDIDYRLSGAIAPDELHGFALCAEYGLSEVAMLPGAEAVRRLGGGAAHDGHDAAALIDTLRAALAAFPGELFNPLLPGTQGQVLRTLRAWDKLCRLTGQDASFLAPLMRSL
ncbi:DUF6031 family protein [Burkholderia plantarii]|uniref:Uncharacterized protein n=2 Tax=Burkholderia plantarii TaxID=41899 RepID=A0A0B6S3Q3_BURPL|nr:DUF6031 family protein [Burkholderia plantarii]AJK49049.1 hypothetical protein BGL_2c09710 [Burkholderia plantarii]ALK33304.1 hypothetical protein bpln_2g10630 [Burkholderia plantarii]GLZ22291.1 hypothetical protein Bpla01_58200 [Burkholderia plantarii]